MSFGVRKPSLATLRTAEALAEPPSLARTTTMSSQENRMAQANITQYPLEIMDSCTPDDINAFLDSQKQKDDVAPELSVVLIEKLMRTRTWKW